MTPGGDAPRGGLGGVQAAALAEISRLLTQTLDAAVVAERIVESLRQLFRARYAVLFRVDRSPAGSRPSPPVSSRAGSPAI